LIDGSYVGSTWFHPIVVWESFFFARGQICPDFFVSVIYLAGAGGKKRAKKKDGAGKKRAKKKDGAGKKRAKKKSIRNTGVGQRISTTHY
jgi:hypothetical protein